MVNKSKLPLLNILPFVQFHYSMRINPIDSDKDLGVNINGSSNFTFHTDMLYLKANPGFAIFKRTCHFVYNIYRKIALFSTLVRCIFEHRPYAWRPSSASSINKLESIQKLRVKWILSDANNYSKISYGTNYYLHLLLMKSRYDYHDLKMLHSIVNLLMAIRVLNCLNTLNLFKGKD